MQFELASTKFRSVSKLLPRSLTSSGGDESQKIEGGDDSLEMEYQASSLCGQKGKQRLGRKFSPFQTASLEASGFTSVSL